MKLVNEAQLLDPEFRKLVIDEMIHHRENLLRKANELRKHEIYRDKNSKWVLQALIREGYRDSTIQQMANRASNVSICRKIVNKLAQTYIGGVDRTAKVESDQASIDDWNDVLDFDDKQKKADRYRQLFRNTMVQIVPLKCNEESGPDNQKYKIVVKVLAPWEYDVIPDNFDPTIPRAVILSDFVERDQFFREAEYLGAQGYRPQTVMVNSGGDNINQVIANSPADAGKIEDGPPNKGDKEKNNRRFIWWSTNYHFTTNMEGEIIAEDSPDGQENPIHKLPFKNITGDQDGQFWAQGGDDVVDGSILINKKLTDLNFIQFTQGWGQMVISAEEIPKKLVGGPDNAFIFQQSPGSTNKPEVYFASSKPPISDWLEGIRTDLAMLLTTNDLSPSSISAKLDMKTVASGIALMIENSEVLMDVMEIQKVFQDAEPDEWELIKDWHELFSDRNALVEVQQKIKKISDSTVSLKFNHVKPPISETDHLNELQLRKGLGINTMLDLIKKDNPDFSEEEAQAKLAEVIADKKKMMAEFPAPTAAAAPGEAPKGGDTAIAKEPTTEIPQADIVDKGEQKTK